ncbi:MAG TPA: alpha/beta fold hydrolase [Steroidobacteraceae bacterium]|jgi:pimeloyl-ACP methyl ester carboxylesterase|nr:alpha/beta fold hydrolase [Steroidobacteraceae bacterium]
MLTLLGSTLAATVIAAHAPVIRLPAPGMEGQTLALHCVEPPRASDEAVLFIHGASFPTLLAAGFEFEGGDSWMDFMAARGFLACGLDFLGFGASSRPVAMSVSPVGVAPLGQAVDTALQIGAAVDYLRNKRGIKRLHVVAHSWGTVPAGVYAATHPATLTSLTLFGPIVPAAGSRSEDIRYAWWSISAQERYRQLLFADALPHGMHLLESAVDRRWASEFAASGPGKMKGVENPLEIPAGPLADINAVKANRYPYSQQDVRIPVFVVYGDYDTEVNDTGAKDFLSRFQASPLKWRLCIDHGTHVMHLERNRKSLYQSEVAFIAAVDRESGGTVD